MELTLQTVKKAEENLNILNNELELRVAERTSQLESANKDLDAFSYSVSHDLRAPVRAIEGFCNIIQNDYSEGMDIHGKDYLSRIHDSTTQMNQIIGDLFNLSHTNRLELVLEPVDLGAVAEKVFTEQKIQYPDLHVEFKIGDELVSVTDIKLMNILLTNLISNALKYSCKCEEARIFFSKEIIEGKIVYFLKDNGTGFDMQYAEKIFLPFTRLNNSDDYPGTGIGLAIVQRVINRLGGCIWVKSSQNKGATFYFTLGDSTETTESL